MKARRKSTGGQIAELAPALLILFIVILFPMIDMIYLALGYCAGWYLNQMTVRACATVKPSEYTTAAGNMQKAWEASSLANMTGGVVVKNLPSAQDFGTATDRETGKKMQFMRVDTQVQINPFISLASVPFLSSLNIDGLTKPITFNYVDKRPLEETDLENQ